MTPDSPRFQFETSAANILDPCTIYGLAGTIGWHTQLAETSGFDGTELWPINPIVTLQLFTGLVNRASFKRVLSAHQSSSQPISQILAHPSFGEVARLAVMPDHQTSLKLLEKIRTLSGDNIPVVLFRETPTSFHEQSGFSNRYIQPEAATCQAWQVSSPQAFVDAMERQGFTGVCLDTNHLRRPDLNTHQASPFADWKISLPAFLQTGKVQELHIQVGRIDMPAIDVPTTLKELYDLMYGTQTTDIIPMLQLINKEWQGGIIVLELRPSAIKTILQRKSRFLSPQDLRQAYESIRHTLNQKLK